MPSMGEASVSSILKQRRALSGLTVEEVLSKLKSRNINISAKTLYGYENGVSTPKVNIFMHLCSIYGISDVMSTMGIPVEPVSDDTEWSLDMYNDFFNASLYGKILILLEHGVPSFSGYEKQLSKVLPTDADTVNLEKLSGIFNALNESGQSELMHNAEYLLSKPELKKEPYIAKAT